MSCLIEKIDCRKFLPQFAGQAQLIFADPPFNIGWDYDVYDDRRETDDYLQWCQEWLLAVDDALHKHGTFWLAIGDEFVSELDCLVKSVGLRKRGHVVWTYTFGMSGRRNFARSHVHLLYYTKTKTKFTFNDGPDIRVPSARQVIYNDKRAVSSGKIPDDTWILYPAELQKSLPDGSLDTWLESRICGTFKERQPGARNQMPLKVLDRIIRSTSNPGDLVIDPFGGTFTTAAAAIAAGRNFAGCDISANCVASGKNRIKELTCQMKKTSVAKPQSKKSKTKSK